MRPFPLRHVLVTHSACQCWMWRRPPDAVSGLVSHASRRTSVTDGSALSRCDRNRNERLARLRVLLPTENAILGIDLADDKRAAVVTDHDSGVVARRRVTCRAWELGSLLDWALERAHAAGFPSVTVACEPTGHRWQVLDQLAAERGCHWCACSRCWSGGLVRPRT